MAELGCYSPSFKKPCDVLRMRRNRARSEGPERRTSSPVVSVPGVRPFSPGPLLNAPGRSRGGVKRRNPFANIENTYNSPKKRALSHTDGEKAAVAPVLDGKLEERPNAGASLREELLNTDRRRQHEITVTVQYGTLLSSFHVTIIIIYHLRYIYEDFRCKSLKVCLNFYQAHMFT